MKIRTSIKRKNAVAGVIEALLLVGLVAIILSVIQLVYIPQMMEEREADHMDDVSNQFSFLKSIIDLQSVTEENVPISSPITLGSRELPYFVTARSLGELKIIDDAGEIQADFVPIAPLTSIHYQVYNNYYPDLKASIITHVLEGGGVIRNQTGSKDFEGEVMIIEPAIRIEKLINDININYNLPIITSISGKSNSPLGMGNIFVRTNYSHSDANSITLLDVNRTRFYTDYVDAWYEYWNESLKDDAHINKGSDYVEIKEKNKEVNLYYRRIYIYAQVSPGWIK